MQRLQFNNSFKKYLTQVCNQLDLLPFFLKVMCIFFFSIQFSSHLLSCPSALSQSMPLEAETWLRKIWTVWNRNFHGTTAPCGTATIDDAPRTKDGFVFVHTVLDWDVQIVSSGWSLGFIWGLMKCGIYTTYALRRRPWAAYLYLELLSGTWSAFQQRQ